MAKAAFRDTERHVRTLEFTYHSRLAIVLTPISVMLLALALARRTKTRIHPYRTGVLALLGYAVFIAFTRGLVLGSLIRDAASPIVLAWGPYVALALCGTIALYLSVTATPVSPSSDH
jgi:lipopolysaccharide export LptBFGC system permease protein LptF